VAETKLFKTTIFVNNKINLINLLKKIISIRYCPTRC
jgi:hypothetical protein